MASHFEGIRDAALALPETDRELLVNVLLESLPSEPADVRDEEFLAELERRRDELRQDPSVAIPWEEAKRQLEEL